MMRINFRRVQQLSNQYPRRAILSQVKTDFCKNEEEKFCLRAIAEIYIPSGGGASFKVQCIESISGVWLNHYHELDPFASDHILELMDYLDILHVVVPEELKNSIKAAM